MLPKIPVNCHFANCQRHTARAKNPFSSFAPSLPCPRDLLILALAARPRDVAPAFNNDPTPSTASFRSSRNGGAIINSPAERSRMHLCFLCTQARACRSVLRLFVDGQDRGRDTRGLKGSILYSHPVATTEPWNLLGGA